MQNASLRLSTSRHGSSWFRIAALCVTVSSMALSQHDGPAKLAAGHAGHLCRGECRMLPHLSHQGKSACAIPPVDYKRAAAANALLAPQFVPLPAGATTFTLHSRPAATKVIYLDFDGHSTANTPWGSTITTTAFDMDSNPSSFSASEEATIVEIWQRVAEIYAPFDVDVTTESQTVQNLINTGGSDTRWGIRCLFGVSTPSPAPGSGGIAYIDAFGWNTGRGTDVPCFVLQDEMGTNAKFNADAASHEIGHVVGLSHDGKFPRGNPNYEGYYEGHGSGATGWAPVMGVGYYHPLVQWSKGEYANANNAENDLQIITTSNGFGYRPDDFPNNSTASQQIPGTASGNSFTVDASGVIETGTDVDWFRIAASAGTLRLNAAGGPVSTMLDIEMTLFNAQGSQIAQSNPVDDVVASITQTVAAGTYFVRIDGVGKGDPLTTGYSDYGSLGSYRITGSYAIGAPSTGSAPVLAGQNNQFYGISQNPKYLNVGITVADSDSPQLASATVTILNPATGQDRMDAYLSPAQTGNITASYNPTQGRLTLTSAGATATVAQFQAALRSVVYWNISSAPNLTTRQVQFQVSDGTNLSNALPLDLSLGYFYVAASYDPNTRRLTLNDDVGDNVVRISIQNGLLVVAGVGPTRIGSLASSQPFVTFPSAGSISIVGNFSGGSDQVTLNAILASTVDLTMGNGNDQVSITYSNITTRLSVNGGNGTDVVTQTGSLINSTAYTAVP